jgi:hypothetical protein
MLALIGWDPMFYGVPVGRNSQAMASDSGSTSGSSGPWSLASTAMMGNLVWHTGVTTKWGHSNVLGQVHDCWWPWCPIVCMVLVVGIHISCIGTAHLVLCCWCDNSSPCCSKGGMGL